jgi:DNA invertase Pin-like site-specific DNA recombinase
MLSCSARSVIDFARPRSIRAPVVRLDGALSRARAPFGKPASMRAALYLRVSTLNGQSTDNRRLDLERVAERHGWQVVEIYEDTGISGARGRENRPAFDRMHKGAVRRDFDVILAWLVDRLGRSLQDLVAFLSEIHAKGVELYLHQQGIDTTTPSGKAMFQMMGVRRVRARDDPRTRAGRAEAHQGQGQEAGTSDDVTCQGARIRVDLDRTASALNSCAARPCVGAVHGRAPRGRSRRSLAAEFLKTGLHERG